MKVLIAGTYDVFHLGHLFFFKEAKKNGTELIVIISHDETAKKNGKRIIHNQKERAEIIKNIKIVDKVVLGGIDITKSVKKIKPDIICIGYDQILPNEIKEYAEKNETKIIKIKKKYNEGKCKSSKIKKILEIE